MTPYYTEVHKFGPYTVTFACSEETIPLADSIDECMLAETRSDIAAGEYEYFAAQCDVSVAGIKLGTAYLGCCFGKPDAFFKEGAGGYLRDMVGDAFERARAQLERLTAALNEAAAGVPDERNIKVFCESLRPAPPLLGEGPPRAKGRGWSPSA